MNRFSTAVVAAFLVLPLAAPAVHGQDASSDAEAGPTTAQDDGAAAPGRGGSLGSEDESELITDMSTVVVSVGDTDIEAGEVRDMLSSMPPQVQTQPMELLVPLAVEELVMRELVLQTAKAEGLDESPEVQQLANGGESEEALENAMIRVYIGGRLEDAASDEAVQAAYDEAAANTEQDVPPLEEVRPQIEQQLQQRRLLEIRDELKSEIDVVYYGPDGEPREDGAAGLTIGGDAEGDASESDGGAAAGSDSETDAPSVD